MGNPNGERIGNSQSIDNDFCKFFTGAGQNISSHFDNDIVIMSSHIFIIRDESPISSRFDSDGSILVFEPVSADDLKKIVHSLDHRRVLELITCRNGF